VRINLVTHEWSEVVFEELTAPAARRVRPPTHDEIKTENGRIIDAGTIAVAPGRDVELMLDVRLPMGAHLNAESPWRVKVTSDGKTLAERNGKSDRMPLKLSIPASAVTLDQALLIHASFAYCTSADGGLCIPCDVIWRMLTQPGRAVVARLEAATDE
jgi:hypothetical protein